MRSLSRPTCWLGLAGALLVALAARAEDEPAAPPPPPPAPAAETHWEGAIGLTTGYRPEFSGSSKWVVKLTPALFLRYGRFTITNASGFVTRRDDDVMRGLGLDMLRNDRMRVNLALRYDGGRAETTSDALKGLGDIKPTLRARLSASWRLDGPWRLGASWSADIFGRGGGNFGDVSLGWEHRFAPATVVTLGTSLSAAGDRYMQTYYGISEEQAARTAYPRYEAGAGLRDMGLFANMRHDIGHEWTVLAGASTTRLLGPAASSPLTTRKTGWGLNAGAAWRF
jgi:outer membrane scaffolding protein for murein synthesis (MipA/OmpV family)